MDRASINNHLKGIFAQQKSEVNYGTFRETGRSSLLRDGLGTRANSVWKQSEFVVAYYEESTQSKSLTDFIDGWKTLTQGKYRQFLILEEPINNWRVYDLNGNDIGDINIVQTVAQQFQKDSAKGNQDKAEFKQIIYFGAPGTGKSFKVESEGSEDDRIRTTFHPDSDYSSFVGCYKPKEVGEGQDKRITYKFEGQCFTKAYIEAWKRLVAHEEGQNINYTLVIEEINRGNCAQIFGDIFQLLDRNEDGFSRYGISPDEDLANHLREKFSKDYQAIIQYANGKFAKIADGTEMRLPCNLSIIATMNTSDQSLFPIDSAFKRRWDWEYIPIRYNNHFDKNGNAINYLIDLDGTTYDWGEFILKVNERIGKLTHSEDKKLGYFFVQANKNNIIDQQRFVSKVIFYLWSDIFKDLSKNAESIFNFSEDEDENNKVQHSFNSFFDLSGKIKTDLVIKFIKQFSKIINSSSTSKSKPSDNRYLVNGIEVSGASQLPAAIVKEYVRLKNASSQDVLTAWEDIKVPGHNNIVSSTPSGRGNEEITCSDGITLYVTTDNWNVNDGDKAKANIGDLIDKVQEKAIEWNIELNIQNL